MAGAAGAVVVVVQRHLRAKRPYTLKHERPVTGFRIMMGVKWRVTDASIPDQASRVVLSNVMFHFIQAGKEGADPFSVTGISECTIQQFVIWNIWYEIVHTCP